MARDLRIDPKAGDKFEKNGEHREITQRIYSNWGFDDLRYTSTNLSTGRVRRGAMFLSNFRRWSKDAKVVHIAD